MSKAFDIDTYLEESTRKSGVPLKVTDSPALEHVAILVS